MGVKQRLRDMGTGDDDDTTIDLAPRLTAEKARAFMAMLDEAMHATESYPLESHPFLFNPGMEQPIHCLSEDFIAALTHALNEHGYDVTREPAKPRGWWVSWTKREGA